MIGFDWINVNGFDIAIHGMRNPLESWKQSDSRFGMQIDDNEWDLERLTETIILWMDYHGYGRLEDIEDEVTAINWHQKEGEIDSWLWSNSLLESDGLYSNRFFFGPQDLKLAKSLIRAGSDEAKFMRQIIVNVDITAPIYWWKEMDTYKVGTTANSTSTMHKLTSKPIEITDFSIDKEFINSQMFINIIKDCEWLRSEYLKTKDKSYWRALIQLLPESYNQTRTWTANYAVLRNIYFARRNHKLQEWKDFCSWIETLPYAKELICLEEKKGK